MLTKKAKGRFSANENVPDTEEDRDYEAESVCEDEVYEKLTGDIKIRDLVFGYAKVDGTLLDGLNLRKNREPMSQSSGSFIETVSVQQQALCHKQEESRVLYSEICYFAPFMEEHVFTGKSAGGRPLVTSALKVTGSASADGDVRFSKGDIT